MEYIDFSIRTNSIELFNLIVQNSNQEIKDDLLNQVSGSGRIDLIQLLLENGANINTYNDKNDVYPFLNEGNLLQCTATCDNPLINAITNNQTAAVQILLENGADVHILNNAPLNKALQMKNIKIKIVQLLLDYGADPNAQHNHRRPLSVASRNNIDVVKNLVENGAICEDHALINAVDVDAVDIVNFLLEKGAICNVYTLIRAIENNNVEIVKILLEHGVDPNAENSEAFYTALRMGHYDVARILLENGFDIHSNIESLLEHILQIPDFDSYGYALRGKIGPVKFLLENGVDANTNNNSALIAAVECNNDKLVEILLENGADPCARNNAALKIASTKKYSNIVNLLLKYGAILDVQ